jgi:hypothetical protein
MTFKDATDMLAVPLEEVAKAIGRSYGTTLAYRNGARVPPPQIMDKVAAFMRNHSRRLAQAADELKVEEIP